jgi:hypothetical protein
MAAIETLVGVTKISNSHYEVDAPVTVGAGIDDVENAVIVVLALGSFAFGTGFASTFTSVTILETQASAALTQRIKGSAAGFLRGVTWVQSQTGARNFDISSGATTTFAAGPDGTPCRLLLTPGAAQYNHFQGGNITIEALYIDSKGGGGDIEFAAVGDFSGFELKDNAPGSTARQVVCLGSGAYTFRFLGARNVAPWTSSTTVNLIDPKGDIPKSGDKVDGAVDIYRTYKAVPYDPVTGLAISMKCYLINNDNLNVVLDGFTSNVEEELFQQSCPNLQSTFTIIENNYTVGFYKYGYMPTAKTFYVLESVDGEQINDGNVLMLGNSSITESSKATVDAYSSCDDAYHLFDLYSSWLEDNYKREGSLQIVRTLDQINLGSLDLDIDATAVQAFDFVGSKITIKSSAYNGPLTTTGAVSLLNGATQTGGIIDSNGDSFLSFESIDSWIVYANAADRDANTSPIDSGAASEIFRFNFSGGTTYYLRLTTGTDILFKSSEPLVSGETLVSLGNSALLDSINSSIQESSQIAEYDGRVTVDLIGGTDSTAYPFGTSKQPTSTIANALVVADDIGVKKIEIRGDETVLPSELIGYELESGVTDSSGASLFPEITVSALSGAKSCRFSGFEVTGVLDDSSVEIFNEFNGCVINSLTGVAGLINSSKLAGTVQLTHSLDVVGSSYGTVNFSVTGANSRLNLPSFSGSITISDMTSATAQANIGVVAGAVTIDASCSNCLIVIANADLVTNNSSTAVVVILQDSGGGGGVADWTAAEREQIRQALGVNGTKTAATGGFLQTLLPASAYAEPPTVVEIDDQLSASHGHDSWETGTGGSGDDAATIYSYFTTSDREEAFKADVSSLALGSEIASLIDHGNVNWSTATGFSTFDPASDAVARVTLVDVVTENTDMVSQPDNSGINSALAILQLINQYHDNKTVFYASNGTTETTQGNAYFMTVFDDDGTTPLKVVSFKNSAGASVTISNATRYEAV